MNTISSILSQTDVLDAGIDEEYEPDPDPLGLWRGAMFALVVEFVVFVLAFYVYLIVGALL